MSGLLTHTSRGQAVAALYDEVEEAEAELWSFAEDRAEQAVSLLQSLRHDGWVEQRTHCIEAAAEALVASEIRALCYKDTLASQAADTLLPATPVDATPWLAAAQQVVTETPPDALAEQLAARPALRATLHQACGRIFSEFSDVASRASSGSGGDGVADTSPPQSNPVATACCATNCVVAWRRALRVLAAADMACRDLEAAADRTWDVMDGYISARVKAMNANIGALAAAARHVLDTGSLESASAVHLSPFDDIYAPWGSADDAEGGKHPEPVPGADVGDDPAADIVDCGELHLVNGRMDVVARVTEDALARQDALPKAPVFDAGPLVRRDGLCSGAAALASPASLRVVAVLCVRVHSFASLLGAFTLYRRNYVGQ